MSASLREISTADGPRKVPEIMGDGNVKAH